LEGLGALSELQALDCYLNRSRYIELAGEGAIEVERCSNQKHAVIMQARQLKKLISFTRGERKNCPAFFPIIWPDHTESADFLALEPVKLQASYYF
jgi:hypothetical protein